MKLDYAILVLQDEINTLKGGYIRVPITGEILEVPKTKSKRVINQLQQAIKILKESEE